MNEQRVELFIKDRKFSFMIPFNDYVPFKKAEKKIIDLIENIEHTEEQLDDAIVYSALQLAIENEKLITKETDDKTCLLYTSPSPRDLSTSRMPSSA